MFLSAHCSLACSLLLPSCSVDQLAIALKSRVLQKRAEKKAANEEVTAKLKQQIKDLQTENRRLADLLSTRGADQFASASQPEDPEADHPREEGLATCAARVAASPRSLSAVNSTCNDRATVLGRSPTDMRVLV